jgi:chemotaxis protein methyltransferase CheR
VLIYFDAAAAERVMRNLLACLGEDGWLVLGASDPPMPREALHETVLTGAGVVYRRATERVPGAVSSLSSFSLAETMPRSASLVPSAEARRSTAAPRPKPATATRRVEPHTDEAAVISSVQELANAGRLADAGRVCAQALDRYRLSPVLLYLHAVLLLEAGRPQDAIGAIRRALYLDRTLVVGHLVHGAALARVSETGRARRALRSAERLLAGLPHDAAVPGAAGEPAGRLLRMVRTQLALLSETAA